MKQFETVKYFIFGKLNAVYQWIKNATFKNIQIPSSTQN